MQRPMLVQLERILTTTILPIHVNAHPVQPANHVMLELVEDKNLLNCVQEVSDIDKTCYHDCAAISNLAGLMHKNVERNNRNFTVFKMSAQHLIIIGASICRNYWISFILRRFYLGRSSTLMRGQPQEVGLQCRRACKITQTIVFLSCIAMHLANFPPKDSTRKPLREFLRTFKELKLFLL